MSNVTITQLPSATTPLSGTEVLPVVQSGTTKQVSVNNLTAGKAVSAASVTATGAVSGTALVPTGSTVPTNGIYSSAANTLDFAVNSVNRLSINSFGFINFTGSVIVSSSVTAASISATQAFAPNIYATSKLGVGTTSPSALLQIKAGTATANTAPLKLTSGTNLTTAEAGAVEYDGTSLYVTGTAASGRGINLAPQMVRVNTARNKTTNDTSLEAIFDPANDSLALAANTLYYFKGVYYLTGAAAVTYAVGFTFSNTQQDIFYTIFSYAAGTIGTIQYSTISTSPTAGIATGNTSSGGLYIIQLEGWFKSNATTGGTFTPTFAPNGLGATAPIVNANTWFMIQPMSSDPNATLLAGNWS